MLDTGATKSLIHRDLVPKNNLKDLSYMVNIHQYNKEAIPVTQCIQNIPLYINNEQFTLPQTWVTNVTTHHSFILGLNFIQSLT